MTPDDVIATRREWSNWNWGDELPAPTVYATADWLAYVMAMANAIPPGPTLEFPTEEEVRWAWPEGVTIVFGHPVELGHVISSHQESGLRTVRDEPHLEMQTVVGLGVGPTLADGVVAADGFRTPIPARVVTYVGKDLADVVTGRLVFGQTWQALLDTVSASQSFLHALAVALGHRLTTTSVPTGPRAVRRRIERELPGLRIIDLASGATTESRGGSIEWSRRWMVRGHWRDQPCGPGRTSRRLTWIDPYVKGPADKPLDVRPTIWKAEL